MLNYIHAGHTLHIYHGYNKLREELEKIISEQQQQIGMSTQRVQAPFTSTTSFFNREETGKHTYQLTKFHKHHTYHTKSKPKPP